MLFWGPSNKDPTLSGSISGSRIFEKEALGPEARRLLHLKASGFGSFRDWRCRVYGVYA